MFNIKKSIYISYPEDVSYQSGDYRVILLWQGAKQDAKMMNIPFANKQNPNEKGIVYAYDNFLEFLSKEFEGTAEKFYSWLANEKKLYILTQRDEDYARLYAMYLIELQYAYKISDEHTHELLDSQRLKDYFTGRPMSYTVTDGWRFLGNGAYPAKGGLVDNPDEISFEIVVYLYHRGYITKEVGDQKIASISLIMLQGLIEAATYNIRNDLAISRKVLKEYLNNDTIDSVGEALMVIDNDPLIRNMFFNINSIDLNDPVVLKKVKHWTTICVNSELDYPEERPRHKYEHDLFYEIFETNDIDTVIENIMPFAQHQFIGERRGKFNDIILTMLYPESTHRSGKFELWKNEDDNNWYWHLKATNGQIIADSEGYTTKTAAKNGIASVKANADLAEIIEL